MQWCFWCASSWVLSLINDVLDISKIESGKMVLTSEPFRLSVLLERAAAVIGPQCEQKAQAFEVVMPEEDEVFVGDAVRLRQLRQSAQQAALLPAALHRLRERERLKRRVEMQIRRM